MAIIHSLDLFLFIFYHLLLHYDTSPHVLKVKIGNIWVTVFTFTFAFVNILIYLFYRLHRTWSKMFKRLAKDISIYLSIIGKNLFIFFVDCNFFNFNDTTSICRF